MTKLIFASTFISLFSKWSVRLQMHGSVIRSIGFLSFANLAGGILGAIGGILVARFVEPEINGQFRLFTIPLMYLTFLHLGTFDGLFRQIPLQTGLGRQDLVKKVASAAGTWNLLVSVLTSSTFIALALWGFSRGDALDFFGWLSQSFVCFGVYYGGYLGATYRTLDNFVALARINLIQSILVFALIAAVALWGFYGLCLRAVLPAAIGIWLLHRARPLRVQFRFDLVSLKELISIGLPLCFWGTLYSSLWLALEYSLMLYFAGLTGVGLFAVAVVIRESLSILPQAVHQVLMPRIIESYGRNGGIGETVRSAFQVTGALLVFMLLLAAASSVALDYLVPIFIPKYIEGLALMKVCLVFAVVQALSIPFNGLVATGRTWLVGKGVLAGLASFPIAVYFLEPIIGGTLAVALGSLLGRLIRTSVAYGDLLVLMRRENN